MRIAVCIEYDGSQFSGWQMQSGELSVQEAVQLALSKVADHPVTVHGAGRTDTGVHACGQIAHFDTTVTRSNNSWVMGANSLLPKGVSLIWTQPVDESFHSRFSAYSRKYRYVVLNRRIRPTYLTKKVSWIHQPLDVNLMQMGANQLLGEHDFSAFRSAQCSNKVPIKTVKELTVNRKGDWVWIDIEANGFLHNMVRIIAGSLFTVGWGDQPPSWIADVLSSKDRTLGGVTSTPDGLYFIAAMYSKKYPLPESPPACRYW